MAEIAEVQIFDVEEYTHGTDIYRGIAQVQITKQRGPRVPIRKEGEFTPSGYERIGTDDAPVRISITSRAASTLATLADQLAGTVVVKTRNAGAGPKLKLTLTNVEYERSSVNASFEQKGSFTLEGTAVTCVGPEPVV